MRLATGFCARFSQRIGVGRCRWRILRGNLSSRRAHRRILCDKRAGGKEKESLSQAASIILHEVFSVKKYVVFILD
jgi:hypothetical protein